MENHNPKLVHSLLLYRFSDCEGWATNLWPLGASDTAVKFPARFPPRKHINLIRVRNLE
jgi:hypothetical protein